MRTIAILLAAGLALTACDDETRGPCAADRPAFSRVAVCSDSVCTTYLAAGDEWVEEWTGESSGACLTLGKGDQLVEFSAPPTGAD